LQVANPRHPGVGNPPVPPRISRIWAARAADLFGTPLVSIPLRGKQMLHHRQPSENFDGSRTPARERLVCLIEARRAYLTGDIEQALDAYTKLLDPPKPHPSARLDVQKILLSFDQMAIADSEFRLARGRLRIRFAELLDGCG
jgi:hypothetical protein